MGYSVLPSDERRGVTFEVRVVAYERPEALQRALASLIGQTCPRWCATVFDDSRSSRVADVVAATRDDRIRYSRNGRRLGAAANIDQCFTPHRLHGGAYGCLLEDDNYWLPEFLEAAERVLQARHWDLLLLNQRIHDDGGTLRDASETTRGSWFQSGVVAPLDLYATVLFMEGVSNGGLVWRLGGDLDLRVGGAVVETGLHEACRSLLVDRPFWFVSEPYAVWLATAKELSARAQESNRVINRGMQAIRTAVLKQHGPMVVTRARHVAERNGRQTQLNETLAYTGYRGLGPALVGDGLHGLKVALKGRALRVVQRNPCAEFLRTRAASNRPWPR